MPANYRFRATTSSAPIFAALAMRYSPNFPFRSIVPPAVEHELTLFIGGEYEPLDSFGYRAVTGC